MEVFYILPAMSLTCLRERGGKKTFHNANFIAMSIYLEVFSVSKMFTANWEAHLTFKKI